MEHLAVGFLGGWIVLLISFVITANFVNMTTSTYSPLGIYYAIAFAIIITGMIVSMLSIKD